MVHLKIKVPDDVDLDVGSLYDILGSKLSYASVGACTIVHGRDSMIYDFRSVEVQSSEVIGAAVHTHTKTTLAELRAVLEKAGAAIIS